MRRLLIPAIILAVLSTPVAYSGDKTPQPVRYGRPVTATPAPALHRTSIAFSPDGKKLAWLHTLPEKAPNDGGSLLIHLWDLDKKIPLVEMKPANEFTYASSPIRFTPNGRMLVAGCFQLATEHEELAKPGTVVKNSVRVWLVASGRELPVMKREDGTIQDSWQTVAIGSDGLAMVAVNSKGGRVWTLPEGEVGRSINIEAADKLILSPDGKQVAGTAKDTSVRVWSTEDGKELAKLAENGRPLGFSPDGKQLASLHEDKIVLWETDKGKQLWSMPAKFGKGEPRFDFSPDGKRFAWNEDGKITVADPATGKAVMTLKGDAGPITFSPDSRRLALACPDGTALVWDLQSSKTK
ncbi:MAG TPA: WD40 repeat domain-containing protein [Gemmataceae bacterium]|nr:WD40 repeat domain-containing protein [Gemmataceae bacterium]